MLEFLATVCATMNLLVFQVVLSMKMVFKNIIQLKIYLFSVSQIKYINLSLNTNITGQQVEEHRIILEILFFYSIF